VVVINDSGPYLHSPTTKTTTTVPVQTPFMLKGRANKVRHPWNHPILGNLSLNSSGKTKRVFNGCDKIKMFEYLFL
jgi:hypothetical protein